MQKQKLVLSRVVPWVLTGSLIALGASADDLKKAVEKQQEVQKKVKSLSLPQKTDCPPDAKSASALRACVQKICPLDAKHPNYESILAQVRAKAEEHYDSHFSDIQNVLKPWALVKMADTQAGFEALQKLKSSNQLMIDPKYQSLHNLFFLLAYKGNAVLGGQSTPEHFSIDPKLTSQKHSELEKSDQEWLAKALEGYYNLPDKKLLVIMQGGNSSGERTLSVKYPGLSLKQALAKIADDLSNASEAIAKKARELNLPPFLFANLMVPKSVIDSARSGEVQSEDDLEEFLNKALENLSLTSLINHPEAYPWLGGRSSDGIEGLDKHGLLSKRLGEMQKYLSEPAFKEEFGTVLDSCASSYAFNAEALPTEKEIAQAKKRSDGVIAAYRTKVFNKLSSHTAALLDDQFKHLQVFYPQSFAAYREDFASTFKSDMLSSKASYDYTQRHPGAAGAQVELFNVYYLLGSDWSPSASMMNNLNQCDRFALKEVNDTSVGSANLFRSSWYSVKNPQFGRASMAHEIGHLAEWDLVHGDVSAESAARYQAIENCLKSKHPETISNFQEQSITAEGQSFEYDFGQYNQEDFGDQLAAIVTPETNLGCLLMSSDERAQPTLINYNPQDLTHSSAVFRALFSEHIRKGGLPKVCQEALAGESPSRDFSSCFK